MTLCEYAINKGYNITQYETLEFNIKATASAILQNIKTLHKTDTGIYYPLHEIINQNNKNELQCYIIQELKKLGVEFYDNNNLWRY